MTFVKQNYKTSINVLLMILNREVNMYLMDIASEDGCKNLFKQKRLSIV